VNILGISAFYHDSAAAVVADGKVRAAVQEERLSRKKHDSNFPRLAIEACLAECGIRLPDIDLVVFYDKPFLKFERLIETYSYFAPRGFKSFSMAMPLWLKEKFFQKRMLRDELRRFDRDFDPDRRLLFSEHHLSHAASAFYPSPFGEAVVLTMDGVGEWTTTSLCVGSGSELQVLKEIHFPHSLGLLYSAMTYYTGFKVNSGEYKVMGLAPYGRPIYQDLILRHLVHLKPDGSFRLDVSYFDYCTGLTMTSEKFHQLFGGGPRAPDEPLTQRHMDLAASVQAVTEEIVLRLCRSARRETGARNLCLAGGVALNCVANGRVMQEGIFDHVWVQPAAGDAGGAVGAALLGCYMYAGHERRLNGAQDGMSGSYLGPSYPQDEIEERLRASGAVFTSMAGDRVIRETAAHLAEGKAIGWFQGRMEFGPRALGNRSILADPRSASMQKTLNLKVKYRESFRPFAPAVLRERVADWFEFDSDGPYMQFVAPVRRNRCKRMSEEEEKLFGIDKLNVVRSDIPAVTHVDYSARLQTVHADTNPTFHRLLEAFHGLTGCPVLVNTSFNVRGEPIVCTPEDAFRCFMGTELDVLVVGNALLHKEDQDSALRLDYRNSFAPD
jgi:carbamoyltransferase